LVGLRTAVKARQLVDDALAVQVRTAISNSIIHASSIVTMLKKCSTTCTEVTVNIS
jgi:hypothetical protein